ncbi:hypothetical protein MKEN_01282600 [Mycena kentingensis (nom. inval.)]|nr:hypothetical protein MKEN_01282600 [Mycena kentingensis (nom. inval.)]
MNAADVGNLPNEVLLHILSFLDIPDLDLVSKLHPLLARLAADRALHNNRLRVVYPARVSHGLFAQPTLRPTVGELVQRGILRGLAIERRWRTGNYWNSHISVRQYEVSVLLARHHAGAVLSQHLTRRSTTSPPAPLAHPDSRNLASSLLGTARKLKWCFRRDTLAKMVRDKTKSGLLAGVGQWLEEKQHVMQDGERVRLAVCPDMKGIVAFYERLSVGK